MKAVDFPQANIKIAENQQQYNTLPAYVTGSENGEVTVCFELDEDELKQVAETGQIWLSFLTFGKPFQPIFGSCLKPFEEPTEFDYYKKGILENASNEDIPNEIAFCYKRACSDSMHEESYWTKCYNFLKELAKSKNITTTF